MEKELEIVKAYIQICKYRFKNLDIFVINTVNDADKYSVPSFILQPIVENAISHGMERFGVWSAVSTQSREWFDRDHKIADHILKKLV